MRIAPADDGDLGASYVPARDNLRESLTRNDSKSSTSRWNKVRDRLVVDPGVNMHTEPAMIPDFASRFQNKLRSLAEQFDNGSNLPGQRASVTGSPPKSSSSRTFEVEDPRPEGEQQQLETREVPLPNSSVTVENCLVILTGIAIGTVLYLLQSVLVPLIMAFFIASMLVPLLDFLTERPPRFCGRTWCKTLCSPCMQIEKKYPNFLGESLTSILSIRLPNALALLLVILLCSAIMVAVGVLVYYSIDNFIDSVPAYIDNIEADLVHVRQFMRSKKIEPDEKFREKVLSMLQTSSAASDEVSSIGLAILKQFGSTFATGALVMLYVIFILLGRVARQRRKARNVTYQVERQLKLYVSWKFLISAATGTGVGATLGLCQVDLAAMFGVLTFFLNFIPTVGLLLAVLLPIPVVLWGNNPYGVTGKILAILVPYGINLLVSNFVEPTIFGKRLRLHPVVVLFALVFWYMMWGVAGAFLSVPIMSVIKICCANMSNPTAQWFSRMLAGHIENDGSELSHETSLHSIYDIDANQNPVEFQRESTQSALSLSAVSTRQRGQSLGAVNGSDDDSNQRERAKSTPIS